MAGPSIPQTLSRRRPPPTGDEETSTNLILGEFQNVPCLSVSEANVILQKVIDQRSKPDEQGNLPAAMPNTDVFVKTRDYLETFARFRGETGAAQVESVSQKLVRDGLIEPFERAQLGTSPSARRAAWSWDYNANVIAQLHYAVIPWMRHER